MFDFAVSQKALSFTLNMLLLKQSFKSLNQLSHQHLNLTFSHPSLFRNPITSVH